MLFRFGGNALIEAPTFQVACQRLAAYFEDLSMREDGIVAEEPWADGMISLELDPLAIDGQTVSDLKGDRDSLRKRFSETRREERTILWWKQLRPGELVRYPSSWIEQYLEANIVDHNILVRPVHHAANIMQPSEFKVIADTEEQLSTYLIENIGKLEANHVVAYIRLAPIHEDNKVWMILSLCSLTAKGVENMQLYEFHKLKIEQITGNEFVRQLTE